MDYEFAEYSRAYLDQTITRRIQEWGEEAEFPPGTCPGNTNGTPMGLTRSDGLEGGGSFMPANKAEVVELCRSCDESVSKVARDST
jgi:hypothetical protein